MPAEFVYISSRRVDPKTGSVLQLDLVANYGPKQAQIDIHLEPPLTGHMPETDAVAQELRELAEALLRIAAKPSAISARDPQGS